jgi:hypothetical protein
LKKIKSDTVQYVLAGPGLKVTFFSSGDSPAFKNSKEDIILLSISKTAGCIIIVLFIFSHLFSPRVREEAQRNKKQAGAATKTGKFLRAGKKSEKQRRR